MPKTAFITGATAGFGQACARRFASQGWNVVATGRRSDRLEDLARELATANIHTLCFDVRHKEEIDSALESLPTEFQDVDVLINNAGLALGMAPAHETDLQDWEVMVDTNIKGLMYCTRAILPRMVLRKTGHVVNLGSIAGDYAYPGGNVYASTKAFVEHFSRNLRCDLHGTGVRVTNIEPGMAETEFSVVRFKGDEGKAGNVYEGCSPLTAEDITEAIWWAVNQPPHVNVNRMEIMPTCQSVAMFQVHREK